MSCHCSRSSLSNLPFLAIVSLYCLEPCADQLKMKKDKEVIQVDKDQQEADVLEQLLRKIRRDVQQAEFLSALGLKDMSDALTRKIGDNIEYIKKKEPGLVARGVLPPAEEVEAEYQLQRSQKKLRESESGNVSGSGR